MPNIHDYFIPVLDIDVEHLNREMDYIEKESKRLLAKGCKLVLFSASDHRNGGVQKVFLNHTCEEGIICHCAFNASDPETVFHAMHEIVRQDDCEVIWFRG